MGRSAFMGKDNWQKYLTESEMDRSLRIQLPDRMGVLVLATLKDGRDLSCQGQGKGEAVWREFRPVDERLPLDPCVSEEVLEWKRSHRDMVQIFWAAPLFDMPLDEGAIVHLAKTLDTELWQEHHGSCRQGQEFKILLEQVGTFFDYPCPIPAWAAEQQV